MDIFFPEAKEELSKGFDVTFLPSGHTLRMTSNESLLDGARKKNIPLLADCGGMGVCGRCRLKLLSGSVRSEELYVLSDEETRQGFILACTSFPTSDVTVEVPPASLPVGVQTGSSPFFKTGDGEMPYKPGPMVEKHFIECPPPSSDNSASDLERLMGELRKKTGIWDFTLNHGILRKLPDLLRKNNWKVTMTISMVQTPPSIIAVEGGDTSGKNYGIVIDIGTTTVEGILVEIPTGKIRLYTSYLNPQVKYGLDVIARMIFAARDRGLLILNDIIVDRVNEILVQLIYETGTPKENVCSIVISGNLVMTYLFLGLNTEPLHKEPQVPSVLHFPLMKASELSLYANPEAVVYFPPGVGNYTGGDLISSLIATGMPDENFILVDIGTNGEVAAYADGALCCASTSAGPAFEGGGIDCGMRAGPGAVNRVHYSDIHRDFVIETIGNEAPLGICGTGLIDLLASLLVTGYVDKKGRFRGRQKTSRFKTEKGYEEFVLTFSTEPDKAISVSEQDISYLIKSKGAIYTGFDFLSHELQRDLKDFDSLYIAGALGGMINIENGIIIGLFPDIERKKFHFIGNGSLYGGWLMLLSREAKNKAESIARSAVHFDLSREPYYMNNYTSSLFLPHTDLHKFPSVLELLSAKKNKAEKNFEGKI